MRFAVTMAVYNEEKSIGQLLEALLHQTQQADEIVIVDDGSTDKTSSIIQDYSQKHSHIKYLKQKNQGPATGRNLAWKNTESEICIFTDGDCVPAKDWIERIAPAFLNPEVGAVAGTYQTLNPQNLLARFVGMEIDWRYDKVQGFVDVHGAYNLAVRRSVLSEMGGFREDYPKPSGEDWDLTYRISSKHKIAFVPEAKVGHFHPESLSWYFCNQMRRAYDRIKVYQDHPEKQIRDTYTSPWIKYQIISSGLFLFSLPCFLMTPHFAKLLFLISGGALFLTLWISFGYYWKRDKVVALYSLPAQFLRSFAWFLGAFKGFLDFSLRK